MTDSVYVGWKKVADDLLEFRSNNLKSNENHVNKIFAENTAAFLAPVLAICPNVTILLANVLTNAASFKINKAWVYPSPNSDIFPLQNLTEEEAAILGKSFRKHLLANKEYTVAVDAWRLANPILQPLFEHSPEFGSIMVAVSKVCAFNLTQINTNTNFPLILHSIHFARSSASLRSAQHLLVSSNMGLAKRVALGALLSIMDMLSDIYVITSYYAEGNDSGASALMAMILVSTAIQLLIVVAQNHKKSKWVLFREIMFVLTCAKPAVDAFRVATGHADEETTFNPLKEMVGGKMAELACESVPGGLLQTYIYINSQEKSSVFLLSILISTLTTGFASALITYDMDVSVKSRKKTPLFYGFVKGERAKRASLDEDEHTYTRDESREMAADIMATDIMATSTTKLNHSNILAASLGADSNTERAVTFLLMIMLASLHNLSRTIGMALMLVVSPRLTFALILAEMMFYHLYKLARSDYVLWVVGVEGALKYLMAFWVHSIVKVLVDFTGLVHARSPKLTGGALFSFLTIVSQGYPFVALFFYDKSKMVENRMATLDLLVVFICLASLWVGCVLAFFWITKKEYWHLFFSTITGKQFTIKNFQESDDPETKMLTAFDNHISFIMPIKEEVKVYVREHWVEFQGAEWFTRGLVSHIGDEFIPNDKLEELGGENRPRRRRSSVGESVREFLQN